MSPPHASAVRVEADSSVLAWPTASGAAAAMVSVIITAYNEESSILPLTEELSIALEELGSPSEVIVVDDGSTDGTWSEIRKAHDRLPGLRAFRLRKNRGKAFALRVGLAEAKGGIIVTLDADLQDNPADIPLMVQALAGDLDMVVGWRHPRIDSGPKRLFSAGYNRVLRRLTGASAHDHNCGLKVFRSELTRRLTLYGDFHRFITLIAFSEGFKLGEQKTRHRPRQFGQSKYNLWRVFTAPVDLLGLLLLLRYQERPLRLLGALGIMISGAGFSLLLYLAVLWLSGRHLGHRPLLTYSAALFLAGLQLLSLGVIAELIVWRSQKPGARYPKDTIRAKISREPN